MSVGDARGRTRRRAGQGAAWLALAPFFLFGLAFEVVPVLTLLRSSLVVDTGFGLGNFRRALTPVMIASFRNSLQLSLSTALLGVGLGTVVAYALVTTRSVTVRHALTALADVTTNFGGAPLAFAFIVTLGSTGVVTLLLQKVGLELYPRFRIYSESGLTVAYLYFQLPLMILLIMPALLGLRADWREAATSLGATPTQFWTRVGLPLLAPSLLGSFLLLFANAFGAYATAWTLTGPDVNLVTVQIAALVRGEVQLDPALADALALLSLGVMAGCVAGYQWLSRRVRRWAA
jgi:putative spermidine/putrescine transport system permease protein